MYKRNRMFNFKKSITPKLNLTTLFLNNKISIVLNKNIYE